MQIRIPVGAALILTMMTMISVTSTTVGWTAEPTVSNTTAGKLPKAQTKVETSSSASKIVPAGFTSMADVQDSVVDGSEAVGFHARSRSSQIYRESLIARAHRRKQEHCRVEHDNLRDWTNYIRGYGPAVWTRNGPECGIHAPSIPFAKRVGGYNAPAWQGVTGIPKPPQISPLTVNAPEYETNN